ncbi:MAG: tRNA (guanosine(37)-N1)-methyltransferase TrmD [Candidatus Omnitrophota bacterium]
MFSAVLDESIIKRAQKKNKLQIRIHDLRTYSLDKHKKVDDRPYGGGPGMVLTPEPIFKAVEKNKSRNQKIILLSPHGKKLNQALAKKIAKFKNILLICGHYEGVDERVKTLIDEEISIGDYVLTGGELPAMILIDCITRLIPGVLGERKSLKEESFENNLLEYPQYTRPEKFCKMQVPRVLFSGNHKKIETWRKKKSLEYTKKYRPDLLKNFHKNKIL